MANKFRGTAELSFTREVDGVEQQAKFKLAFDANAFCEIETETDMDMGGVLTSMENIKNLSFTKLRAILWGGLQRHHPEVNVRDAGDIISDAGMSETMEVISSAFSGTFKTGGAKGEAKPGKGKSGAGTQPSSAG